MSIVAVYDCMLFFRAASRPHRVQTLFQLVDPGSSDIARALESADTKGDN